MLQSILTASIETVVVSALICFPLLMLNDLILGFKEYQAEKHIVINPHQYEEPAGPAEPHHLEPAGPQTLAEALPEMTAKRLKAVAKHEKIKGYSKLKKDQLRSAIVSHMAKKVEAKVLPLKVLRKAGDGLQVA